MTYAPDDGYVPCACRDCMNVAIGRRGKAMCDDCLEAGCEYGEHECSSPYAYGCDDRG